MPAKSKPLASIATSDAVQLFMAQKRADRLKATTLAIYAYALRLFLETPGLPQSVEDLAPKDAISFTTMLHGRGLSRGAINTYQRHTWTFLRWAYLTDLVATNISEKVKKVSVPNPRRRTATPEIREKLLKVARHRKEMPYRDVALIELLWSTGVRRGEIGPIDLSMVDFERGLLFVPQTKTDRPRTVGIGVMARLALEEYIIRERGRAPGPLFLERGKQRITNNAIRGILRGLAEDAGVVVTSHDFRRATGARLLSAGVPLDSVARQLGHSNLATTLTYAEAGRDARSIEEFHRVDAGRR